MRTPKGKSAPKKPAAKGRGAPSSSKAGGSSKASKMETDAPAEPKTVWRPGVDPVAEDEELDYDPTAYDCLHRFQLDWPCLSFDIITDELGGPRSTFPHSVTMVAGTQAASAKQNYFAFLRLANLGQGRHGKRAKKAGAGEEGDEDDSDEDMSEDDDSEDEEVDEHGNPREPKEDKLELEVDLEFGPPRMHYRMVNHAGGINRIRCCPQEPGVVAVWADSAQVRIYDGTKLLKEMAEEAEPPAKARAKVELKPLTQHGHAMEGFALGWSGVKAGRLASGDGKKNVFVWEPQEGGRWAVGGAYQGHEQSVEDISWSPTEETVLASCSVDQTIRVWDTRERGRPMITVKAHDSDVNVISWNRLVAYMMASGADDGSLRIWDLRSFTQDGPVSEFKFHKGYVTSLEWCPYEGSMLTSSASDNQVAVWDLALERDAEEEAALAPASNAQAPEGMPAQLLFLHAGQRDVKESHWHAQIPGMIASTAEDTINIFKPSNL